MALDVSEATRREYAARMNRVVDHIQAHLAEPLDLGGLARVACFSPFHFHRLFQAWTGETLHDYILRLRLERAAQRLRFDLRSSITDIALDCGFSGSSPFARAFRQAYGVTASQWRIRKNRQTDRNGWEAAGVTGGESWRLPRPGRDPETPVNSLALDVHVRPLPPCTLAYLRAVGPHMGDADLFRRLFTQLQIWAGARGLLTPETEFFSLIHDTPDLTPRALQRWEAALTVPEGTMPDGPIGIQRLEGGAYATARVHTKPEDVPEAWNVLLRDWLPASGCQPDHRPALAFLRSGPGQDFLLEIALPVRPL